MCCGPEQTRERILGDVNNLQRLKENINCV